MIYAVIEKNGDRTAEGFFTWQDYHAATFSPDATPETVQRIPARISGRNYLERKSAAYEVLLNFSEILGAPGLDYFDLFFIQNDAERIARRYGLLQEARENAVC